MRAMKDSGVEWIGEIPQEWKVRNLKKCLAINNGADYKHIVSDYGYPVLGTGGAFTTASNYMYDGEVVLFGRKGTINKPMYFNGKFWAVDTVFYGTCFEDICCKYIYYYANTIPYMIH